MPEILSDIRAALWKLSMPGLSRGPPSPNDYWRFTPDALKLLSKKLSRVIDCQGWGNFEAWLLIRDGLRFEGIPHAKWHPLHKLATRNDPDWPIVTWIILEK